MLCAICQETIPEARMEILPDTTVCINCSNKNPPKPRSVLDVDIEEACQADLIRAATTPRGEQ